MEKKRKGVDKISGLLIKYLCADQEVANELAEKIFTEIVEPAVEEERNEWIVFSKAAPDKPDGRGLDS